MAAAPLRLGAAPRALLCSMGTASPLCSAPRSGDLCFPHVHSPPPRGKFLLAKRSADDLLRVSAAKHEMHPNSIPPPPTNVFYENDAYLLLFFPSFPRSRPGAESSLGISQHFGALWGHSGTVCCSDSKGWLR